MKAFHGKQSIKDELIAQLKAHYAADEIIKGIYWENGKGCAYVETLYGIPEVLARVEDGIFEKIPNKLSKEFPIQFIESINVGADLSQVWPKFAVWLLTDPQFGVIQYAKIDDEKSIIQKVADLYENNSPISLEELIKIIKAAADANDSGYTAGTPIYVAANAAAAYVAANADSNAKAAIYVASYDYTYAAVVYAAAAAYAAAYANANAADAYDAREKHRMAQKDKLLALLSACPGE